MLTRPSPVKAGRLYCLFSSKGSNDYPNNNLSLKGIMWTVGELELSLRKIMTNRKIYPVAVKVLSALAEG
jgi:hypothetical protein